MERNVGGVCGAKMRWKKEGGVGWRRRRCRATRPKCKSECRGGMEWRRGEPAGVR